MGKLFFKGHLIFDTIVNQNNIEIKRGSLSLFDKLEFKVECTIEIFHNKHNYFVLCYPAIKAKRGGKIIVVKLTKKL